MRPDTTHAQWIERTGLQYPEHPMNHQEYIMFAMATIGFNNIRVESERNPDDDVFELVLTNYGAEIARFRNTDENVFVCWTVMVDEFVRNYKKPDLAVKFGARW